ncbi:MAG TPA: hypothetical protein DEQ20_08080 [Desulfobulbaceae bacterium]|nr:MAG: hypothetical protein A2520_02195 [Deltaproteobacteria bacterium RIFOXYD12_FULL_53_23]HCC54864.1 hypothetical protein [Desulfobulbaceae bacterium]
MRLVFVQNASRILLCGLFLLLLAGCRDDFDKNPAPKSAPSPARKITIGFIPETSIFAEKKDYALLASYLSKKTGVAVELKILSRYGNILDNFQSAGLDGAFLGSFVAALAINQLGVEPLVRGELEGGVSTYYGIIFARKNLGIKTAQDMKGKILVFVDKATTAGWLFPLYFLRTRGIMDTHSWFKKIYYSGSHENSLQDVLDGRADVGAVTDIAFYREAKKNPRIKKELEILATSEKVPGNTLAVRHDLDPALKSAITSTLLSMDQDAEEGKRVLAQFGARRFIATLVQEYVPVIKYAKYIGLDLATYDHVN